MKVTLRQYLAALIVAPILGLVGSSALTIDDAVHRNHISESMAQDVRAAVALDDLRNVIGQELVPSLGEAALSQPTTLSALGIDPTQAALLSQLRGDTALNASRATTDAAVLAAMAGPARADARVARSSLARARAAIVLDADQGLSQYDRLLDSLTTAVNTHLQAAQSYGIEGTVSSALTDMTRISHAGALASRVTSLYLGRITAPDEKSKLQQTASFLEAWGAYRLASSDATFTQNPQLAQAWKRAADSITSRRVDGILESSALDQAPPTLSDLTVLGLGGTARDKDFHEALTLATSDVLAQARVQSQQRASELQRQLVACAVLVAMTVVGALFVIRQIARPLHRLAEQSRQVAGGNLVQVKPQGPLEVRVVAQGLAATVDSLRRMQDQANAIAAGDLDSSLVTEALPGPLGQSVHASVTQVLAAIHAREKLQADLAHQASHDALTELPNRAQTLALAGRALHRAARRTQRVGLLFVDLDHFKAVNDNFGHGAGDEVLRTVAARMHDTVRGGDVVCRLGGDEFIVLVEGVEDEKGLIDLGRRLITSVSQPIALTCRPPHSVRVGASIGVAVGGGMGGTHTAGDAAAEAEQLLKDADAAAYRAKNAGRGVVEVYDDELRAELSARTELEAALSHGLAHGELVLYYQPVLELGTGQTKSVEALMRWDRPGHGLVPPDAFIPVAETTGLICDLGRWVLSEATAQLARWDAEGHDRGGLDVAVNISGRHLAQTYLLSDVSDALTASGIHPSRLTIEITETVLVQEPLALDHLRSLRELGVRVAIDDFGTGYTSIGQLSRLPVDILKIDRSFIASPEAGNADLVRLLISAAHSFSVKVVAEGVEEDEQLSALLAASCDAAQGYLFARPSPPDELPIDHPSAAHTLWRRRSEEVRRQGWAMSSRP